jgi:hypothetical protein
MNFKQTYNNAKELHRMPYKEAINSEIIKLNKTNITMQANNNFIQKLANIDQCADQLILDAMGHELSQVTP